MKIWLVGESYDGRRFENVDVFIGAFASYERAKAKVMSTIDAWKTSTHVTVRSIHESEPDVEWTLEYDYDFDKDTHKSERELQLKICECDLEEGKDIPIPAKPVLEARCDSLRKHNKELKKELANCKAAMSAAQTYMTFYDGGKYADRDDLLSGMHSAKSCLEKFNEKEGNTLILKLFEGWKSREKG